ILGRSWRTAAGFRGRSLRDEPTSIVEAAAEMALSDRGPQDSRRDLAGDGEFRREVLDIERPAGRRKRGGMGQREVARLEPPCVRKKVQARDQEDERAQGGGRDADDLLQDGPGRREDGADPGEGQGDRREEAVPHPAIHAAPAPQSTTRVPRNGSPRIADRSPAGSRPWTTLNGVRSRATTRAATGSNTMLGPAASWPFPARSMRSRKLIRSSSRAFGSFRGSVVYTPATEVAFTMRAAWTNRASDALTRSVVWPGRVPAMMTIGYRRASFAASAYVFAGSRFARPARDAASRRALSRVTAMPNSSSVRSPMPNARPVS